MTGKTNPARPDGAASFRFFSRLTPQKLAFNLPHRDVGRYTKRVKPATGWDAVSPETQKSQRKAVLRLGNEAFAQHVH